MADSPTPHASSDGFEFKFLEDVQEPIAFRLSKTSRSNAERLDWNLSRQQSHLVHSEDHKDKQAPVPLYVGSLNFTFRCQLISCIDRIQGKG